MSLNSFAQEILSISDDSENHSENVFPLEIVEVQPIHSSDESEEHELHLEPEEFQIIIDELPGAPPGTKDPEPVLEVSLPEEEVKEDENDAKKSKKNEKWDWESKGAEGFVSWIKERVAGVPSHSGYDSAGLERAMAYLDRLDNEISKAMRLDLDGDLDANKIEEVRSQIDDGLARLQQRLDKVKKTKKSNRKKKAELEVHDNESIIKEAQKATGVQGTFVVVSLLISRLGRIIINGTVSAGHDSADMFYKLSEKYKLNDREQAELMQYLADSGFPMRGDRGYLPDEEYYESSSDNYDFSAHYKA